MFQPKTLDEYIDLVHQAIYEVDELRACIEDDPEEMERYVPFLDQLDVQLRGLYAEMTGGSYTFPASTDLPFMAIVAQWGRDIPFRQLLQIINTTHRNGF
jgi:hypothetical protein